MERRGRILLTVFDPRCMVVMVFGGVFQPPLPKLLPVMLNEKGKTERVKRITPRRRDELHVLGYPGA